MTRAEKVIQARRLRDEGLLLREIGERMGVTGGCVAKWLNPEKAKEWARAQNARRHEVKKAWAREKNRTPEGRGTCADCGGPLGIGQARRGGVRCQECISYEAARKFVRLERLWNEGKTFPEICAALGCTQGALADMIDRGRAQGYDLPYRHIGAAYGHKFPEQVAA